MTPADPPSGSPPPEAQPGPTLRVLLVEDEAPGRILLREYLEKLPGVEVAGECGDGFSAVEVIAREAPDVLLLDIRLPGLDGFEVLELLGDDLPEVIFTTAYDEHAVRAFEIGAVDYLLKPFSASRLSEALARARERVSRGERSPLAAGRLDELRRAAGRTMDGGRGRVLIREEGKVHVLPVAEIDYVEAAGDAVRFYRGGEFLSRTQTLTEVEESFVPGPFVRIHRSYLLNMGRLDRLELYAKDSRVAILQGGERLPVSRSGYGRLKERLGEV